MKATALDHFLNEVSDVLRQLFVGGLACPDPDLPEELLALAERARELNLASGAQHLANVQRQLRALAAEPRSAAVGGQGAQTGSAWDDTQRLLAWLRLMRTERDLTAVQTRLSERAAADATAEDRTPDPGPTLSLVVWPIGLQLGRRGRLVIHALAQHGDTPRRHLLLLDELTDADPIDPIHSRVISRLFQDGIRLASVMASPIRLVDHPVAEHAGALVVRPAFSTRPSAGLPAESAPLEPPWLDATSSVATGDWPVGPFQLTAHLRREGERTRVERRHGTPLPLATSELLRFNADKLLVRERQSHCALDLTLVRQRGRLTAVSGHTDFDGRIFPAADPTAFGIDGQALFLRAVGHRCSTSSLDGLGLTAAALSVAGPGLPHQRESVEGVRAALAHLAPAGIREHYRAGLIASLLEDPKLQEAGAHSEPAQRSGAEPAPEPKTPTLVREALELLAAADPAADLAKLARVLGRPVDATSPADRRHLDGQLLYATLWLALNGEEATQAGQSETSSETLRAVAAKWAWAPLDDPTPAEICGRALLLARVGPAPADAEAEAEPTSDTEGPTSAKGFLDAHLEVWRKPGRQTPMPSLLEVIQLGEVWARLHGRPVHGRVVEPLGLPMPRLRRMCLDALLDWSLSDQDPPPPPQRWAAADALVVIAAAGLSDWFLAVKRVP